MRIDPGARMQFGAAAIALAAWVAAGLMLNPAPAATQPIAGEAYAGRAFINGQEIPQPWEFSGLDADTMRLNGIPFTPIRSEWLSSASPSRADSLRAALESALAMRACSTAWHAPPGKAMEAFAGVYRASSLVESVGPSGSDSRTIWVRFKGRPPIDEFVTLPPRDYQAPRERGDEEHEVEIRFRRELLELFWTAMKRGARWDAGPNGIRIH